VSLKKTAKKGANSLVQGNVSSGIGMGRRDHEEGRSNRGLKGCRDRSSLKKPPLIVHGKSRLPATGL